MSQNAISISTPLDDNELLRRIGAKADQLYQLMKEGENMTPSRWWNLIVRQSNFKKNQRAVVQRARARGLLHWIEAELAARQPALA